jgi:hypothetical protein
MQRLERANCGELDKPEPELIFSSQFHTEQAKRSKAQCKLFLSYRMMQLIQRFGGAGRNRTDDILLAKQALYQLSYGPKRLELVGLGGLEPPTSRLSSARSNQLSYKPEQPSSATALLGCQKACYHS